MTGEDYAGNKVGWRAYPRACDVTFNVISLVIIEAIDL
jgi:hypothetical protein